MIVAEGKKKFVPSEIHGTRELEDILANAAGLVGRTASAWAKAKSNFEALKDFKDIKLAKAMPTEGAEHERKRVAHLDPEYIQHIQGMADARELMMDAEAAHVAAQAKYETVKSILLKRFGSS